MPLLPNLDLKSDPVRTRAHTHTRQANPNPISIHPSPCPPFQAELTELVQTYKQEVTEAACELICDWAQKILKRSFDTVVEIARYLIQEHIVNPRCSQAELVASAALAGAHPRARERVCGPHRVSAVFQEVRPSLTRSSRKPPCPNARVTPPRTPR